MSKSRPLINAFFLSCEANSDLRKFGPGMSTVVLHAETHQEQYSHGYRWVNVSALSPKRPKHRHVWMALEFIDMTVDIGHFFPQAKHSPACLLQDPQGRQGRAGNRQFQQQVFRLQTLAMLCKTAGEAASQSSKIGVSMKTMTLWLVLVPLINSPVCRSLSTHLARIHPFPSLWRLCQRYPKIGFWMFLRYN